MPKRKADGAQKLAAASAADDGADRLGSLPDDVLGRILSFLPTAQVVLTYQLSRRWRRLWAHVLALNLSVLDNGGPRRYRSFAREALARFPTAGIPSVSLEFHSRAYIAEASDNGWYGDAMERAVGSVRISVPPRGLSRLEFPRCTRAEAVTMRLSHGVNLELPPAASPVPFGRLTELSLSRVLLPAGTPPFHEFLSSCCPRLKRLRLCCVRGGDAVRALVLRSDALEALDLNNVDGLARVDVVAANLRSLSVRSCFRFPVGAGAGAGGDQETEVVVSAPRIESICWYRSYPKRLDFPAGLTHVRRLTGLKLPTLGRSDQFDFPYTVQLLRACSLTQYLHLDFIVPDETTLRNWSGPEPEGSCEDLMAYVPQLPGVSVLSLKIRWGFYGSIGQSLVSLLSRVPSVKRLHILSSPYCRTVLESQDVLPPRVKYPWGFVRTHEKLSRLDCVREISIDGLKGMDEQEFRIIELLLGAAPPLLERMSLKFDDTATLIVDDIAAEIQAHFPGPMATGRWVRIRSTVLTWTKRNLKSFFRSKRK
ncbi:hypothetical protein ACQ4PT_006860 [Festuca glaucescens]